MKDSIWSTGIIGCDFRRLLILTVANNTFMMISNWKQPFDLHDLYESNSAFIR